MNSSISLLPEDLREQEDDVKRRARLAAKTVVREMHIPEEKSEPIKKNPAETIERKPILIEKAQPESVRAEFRIEKKVENVPKIKIEKEVSPKSRPDFFVKNLNAVKSNKLHFVEGEKAPMQNEFDLLAEDYSAKTWNDFWLMIKRLALFFLIFSIVVAGLYLLFYSIKQSKIKIYNEKKESIESVKAKIQKLSDSKNILKEAEKKIDTVLQLQNERILWTVFLDKLEHNITQDVYYLDLATDENGKVVISARGKTYGDAAKQLKIFETADFVETAEVNSVRMMEPAVGDYLADYPVSFAINLKLKKELLNK